MRFLDGAIMHPVGGRLLFYRWPERHACLAEAPAAVHEVVRRCTQHVVFFKIPHGSSRAWNDPDGPEDGTACAQYNLSASTPGEASVAEEALRRLLGAGPMLCKQDAGGTPHAAVAWVEGGSPLEPVAGRALELMHLPGGPCEAGKHARSFRSWGVRVCHTGGTLTL